MPLTNPTEVVVLSVTATLTDAEVKALPTTSRDVIPAPGAGKIIFPFGAFYHVNWVADYEGIGSDAQLQLRLNGIDVLVPVRQDVVSSVSGLLAGGGPDGTNAFAVMAFLKKNGFDLFAAISSLYDSDISNQPLVLSASNSDNADFTGGNAGNSLKVTVLYTIIDV